MVGLWNEEQRITFDITIKINNKHVLGYMKYVVCFHDKHPPTLTIEMMGHRNDISSPKSKIHVGFRQEKHAARPYVNQNPTENFIRINWIWNYKHDQNQMCLLRFIAAPLVINNTSTQTTVNR